MFIQYDCKKYKIKKITFCIDYDNMWMIIISFVKADKVVGKNLLVAMTVRRM